MIFLKSSSSCLESFVTGDCGHLPWRIRRQALPASRMPFETLRNLNNRTSKYAKWCVRIKDPKLIPYTFQARGETMSASKFGCLLVSQCCKEYMTDAIPFSFHDRKAAENGQKKYIADTVWTMTTPAFDTKQKPSSLDTP